MRTDFLRRVWAIATVTGGLVSQNVTVPAVMNGVEGGSASNIPFGSNLACRYQCIYDAAELPWTGPRLINGISIRADNGTPLAPGLPINGKQFLDITVVMSTTTRTSSTASANFEENYGEDVMQVLTLARVALPAQPAVGVGPRAANVDLMFATPWFYGLSPVRSNQPPPTNLLVEILILSQPSGSYRLDSLGACTAVAVDFGNQDPACTVPGITGQPTLTTDASMQGGSSFTWTVSNAPANGAFLLASNLTSVGGLYGQSAMPLPYPMFDPANPSLPPPGLLQMRWSAPGCWFNLDPVVTLFGVTNAAGVGRIATMMPTGREYVGLTLYGQAFLQSLTANQLQIVTTKGRHSTICGPLGVVRIHQFYNGTGTPTPPPPVAGAVQYGLGLVMEVR